MSWRSISEVAAELAVTEATIRTWIQLGEVAGHAAGLVHLPDDVPPGPWVEYGRVPLHRTLDNPPTEIAAWRFGGITYVALETYLELVGFSGDGVEH